MTDKERMTDIESVQSILAKNAPFPMCVINDQGKVTVASPKIDEVFLYDDIKDSDIFALTGIKYKDYEAAATAKSRSRSRETTGYSGFRLARLRTADGYMAIYFHDITNLEGLKSCTMRKKSALRLCMSTILTSFSKYRRRKRNDFKLSHRQNASSVGRAPQHEHCKIQRRYVFLCNGQFRMR